LIKITLEVDTFEVSSLSVRQYFSFNFTRTEQTLA